ncbi:hypothetical protein H6F67_06085 [Microcoleus sp. FACHB-1515]|uniref:hypothetical protein n=1 Tax=Cyanophyceae TaxID=3028117 RepID=UPI001684D92D|nr:hypothetical protein [Microcoleus sp. FACHB-1515]MBD2089419.1 hypothetical protein [Microcoleus sp. FACHB-1515]
MVSVTSHDSSEAAVWDSLKRAIAQSSGFQRWQAEREEFLAVLSLDQRVQRYLRETLETLAY